MANARPTRFPLCLGEAAALEAFTHTANVPIRPPAFACLQHSRLPSGSRSEFTKGVAGVVGDGAIAVRFTPRFFTANRSPAAARRRGVGSARWRRGRRRSGDEPRVLAGFEVLEVSVESAELEDALHVVGGRDEEQPAVLCRACGARVEQQVEAARVHERDPAEIEDELCAPAVERDLDLGPGPVFVQQIQLAVEPHDRTSPVTPGRRRELRRQARDHHSKTIADN